MMTSDSTPAKYLGDRQAEAAQRGAGVQHEVGEEAAGEAQAPDLRGDRAPEALQALRSAAIWVSSGNGEL